MSEMEEMVCPDCHGERFSWVVKMVQFGVVQRSDSGTFDEIGMKNGEITGTDGDLFCTSCDDYVEYEDLIPAEDAEGKTGEESPVCTSRR